MKITTWADEIDVKIRVTYFPNQSGWSAEFDHASLLENHCLCSTRGIGPTLEEALRNHIKQIQGKTIVVTYPNLPDKKFAVPFELEL